MKSKDIYKILIRTKPIPKSKAKKTYSLKYNLTEEADWKSIYSLPRKITRINILIDLQFKILHRYLPTNKYLHACKLYDSPRCSFCQFEIETIEHLYFHCYKVKTFWLHFCDWLPKPIKNNFKVILTEKDILLGYKNNSNMMINTGKINQYILYAKRYIYQQKINIQPLTLKSFALLVSSYSAIDKKYM